MAKMTKKHGFTLVEAVVSLVVLAGTTLIIQLVMQTSSHIRPMTLSTCANWHLFIAELESPKHQFELHDVQPQRLVLVDQSTQKSTGYVKSEQFIYVAKRVAIFQY